MADITNQLQAAAGTAAAGGGGGSYIVTVNESATFSVVLFNNTVPGSLSVAATYNFSGGSGSQLCIDFSPDGNYVAVGGADNWSILDHTTPGSLTFESNVNIGASRNVRSISYSPDGDYIGITTSSTALFLAIYDVSNPASPSQVATYSLANPNNFSDWSPTGDYFAAIRGPDVTLLNVSNPASPSLAATYSTLTGSGAAYAIDYSLDGNYLIINYGNVPATVIFDMSTPGSITLSATYSTGDSWFNGVQFSPDNKYFVWRGQSSSSAIRLYDFTTPGTISYLSAYGTGRGGAKFLPGDSPYKLLLNNAFTNYRLVEFTPPSTYTLVATYAYNNGYMDEAAYTPY
jgi:WD40 repeat protein